MPPLQRPSRSNISEGGRGKGSGFHFSSAERILSMPSMPENLLAGVSSGEHATEDGRTTDKHQITSTKSQISSNDQNSKFQNSSRFLSPDWGEGWGEGELENWKLGFRSEECRVGKECRSRW